MDPSHVPITMSQIEQLGLDGTQFQLLIDHKRRFERFLAALEEVEPSFAKMRHLDGVALLRAVYALYGWTCTDAEWAHASQDGRVPYVECISMDDLGDAVERLQLPRFRPPLGTWSHHFPSSSHSILRSARVVALPYPQDIIDFHVTEQHFDAQGYTRASVFVGCALGIAFPSFFHIDGGTYVFAPSTNEPQFDEYGIPVIQTSFDSRLDQLNEDDRKRYESLTDTNEPNESTVAYEFLFLRHDVSPLYDPAYSVRVGLGL